MFIELFIGGCNFKYKNIFKHVQKLSHSMLELIAAVDKESFCQLIALKMAVDRINEQIISPVAHFAFIVKQISRLLGV